MADDIKDAFLLYVDSEDSVREELDKRIRDYKGERKLITRDVLIPLAKEHGFSITEEDVEYYIGHEVDGSEVPSFLFENDE